MLPLLSLIAVSLFFGYFLAVLEAPLEIMANDDVIAARFAFSHSTNFKSNLTIKTPEICVKLHFSNLTSDEFHERGLRYIERMFLEVVDAEVRIEPDLVLFNESGFPGDDQVNASDLIAFAAECGKWVYESANNFSFTMNATDALETTLKGVSFDWIRCDANKAGNWSSKSYVSSVLELVWNPFGSIERLRPGLQEQNAVDQWSTQQQELFDVYLQSYLEQGFPPLEAHSNALSRSFDEATGFDGCHINTSGAAWFWFTVMTTIGYGNTAPQTAGGHAMVFTFGFLCILFFGVVLAQSGTIMTAIFDDWVERVHLSWLRIPSLACIFWGVLYYSWMLIIAAYTQAWKQFRLEEEFQFSDAYWFSFISTTTVGLGDYFLEHSLILPVDLIVFSILFLLGFVLLSNFLVKLSQLVVEVIGLRGPSLAEALQRTNAPCCPPLPNISAKPLSLRRRRNAETPAMHPETVDIGIVANTNACNSKRGTEGMTIIDETVCIAHEEFEKSQETGNNHNDANTDALHGERDSQLSGNVDKPLPAMPQGNVDVVRSVNSEAFYPESGSNISLITKENLRISDDCVILHDSMRERGLSMAESIDLEDGFSRSLATLRKEEGEFKEEFA